MAHSEGSILIEALLEKLASLAAENLDISRRFETDLETLQYRMILIRDHIHHYIQLKARYIGVSEFLTVLVHKVDDLLDELNVYTFRQHIGNGYHIRLGSTLESKFSKKLRKIIQAMDYVTETLFSLQPATKFHVELDILTGNLLALGSENPSLLLLPGGASSNTVLTLMKRAYEIVRSYFDLRIWIDVSGNLDAVKTMEDILGRLSESGGGGSSSTRSERRPLELLELRSLLRGSFLGNRFLLVLDNVMDVKQAEWRMLNDSLRSGRFGSKVIVTTESYPVRELMQTSLLPFDEHLQLSYMDLPPYQRLCFRYCSKFFPVNYVVNRQKLIHQWIALSLIPSLPGKDMEEIGEEYIVSLLSRFSFFCGVSADDDGEFQHLTIHEPSALFRSYDEEEKFNDKLFNIGLSSQCAFHLISETNISSRDMHFLFTHLKHLRVLNLSGCGFTKLHESIGDLRYLRYLDLANTLIQRLPKNICYLFNLQTLHLSDCKHLRELPRKMSNLINMRHLNLKGCESLARMPANIGKLRKLQTLSMFIIGKELEESLFQLKHLHLQGELEIKQLEKTGYLLPDMCLEHKLLHSLVLSWGNNDEAKMGHYSSRQTAREYDSRNAESVLSCLVPNRSSRNFSIHEFPGAVFPRWLNRIMLPSLTKLVLFNCIRCEILPPLGPFQSLRILHLQGMNAVVRIGSEFFGREHGIKLFPSLCELTLKDFPVLRSWESPEFTEAFPCLHKLSIFNCPMLSSTPCFPSLRHLDINNCSKLILGTAELSNLYSNLASTLQSLEIGSCPEIQEFPDWMENLTSLQSLSILQCQNLKFLSEGFQHLKALEHFSVRDCPLLERRCQKDIGEDWHKIHHIPFVDLGPSKPQEGRS